MRRSRRTLPTLGLAATLVFAVTAPASATVHEIVASFCAAIHEVQSPTGDLHNPPGLTPEELGGTSEADNIAQPLLSSGAFTAAEADGDEEVVLGPATDEGDTLLLINEDKPQVKLLGTNTFFYDAHGDVYVEIGQPDPDFPGFEHCAISPNTTDGKAAARDGAKRSISCVGRQGREPSRGRSDCRRGEPCRCRRRGGS